MQIHEFNHEYKLCQRLMVIRAACSVAVLFAAMGIAVLTRRLFGDSASLIVPLIMFGVGLPLMLTGFYYADRTFRKFPRLICSNCDGSLYRSKSVVVATGNCPTCGRRVLSDDSIGT